MTSGERCAAFCFLRVLIVKHQGVIPAAMIRGKLVLLRYRPSTGFGCVAALNANIGSTLPWVRSVSQVAKFMESHPSGREYRVPRKVPRGGFESRAQGWYQLLYCYYCSRHPLLCVVVLRKTDVPWLVRMDIHSGWSRINVGHCFSGWSIPTVRAGRESDITHQPPRDKQKDT